MQQRTPPRRPATPTAAINSLAYIALSVPPWAGLDGARMPLRSVAPDVATAATAANAATPLLLLQQVLMLLLLLLRLPPQPLPPPMRRRGFDSRCRQRSALTPM